MKKLLAGILTFCIILSSFTTVFADERDDRTAFVTRLYENFLGREPDEPGLEGWVNALEAGMSGSEMFLGFYNSEEFSNMDLTVEEHVTIMYLTLLNREPDADGFTYWTNKIYNGCTRSVLLEGFLNSTEFTNLCNEYGINRGTYHSTNVADNNADVTAFVARLYRNCFNREYDRAGLEDWVSILVGGKMGGGDVALGFFHSQEFTNLDTTDDEFINIVYNTFFDREPDDEGYENWMSALSNGKTRDYVLDGFINSPEFANLCAVYGISVSWNPRAMYPQACAVLDQVGWNLQAALNWCAMTYQKYDTDPNLGTRYYANYGFTYHKGNCYVMAACFAEMAMALGYDVRQVSGTVPLRRGGMGPHSWVYIDNLIYDPDYQWESGNSGYAIRYGTPGTWRYTGPVDMPY